MDKAQQRRNKTGCLRWCEWEESWCY